MQIQRYLFQSSKQCDTCWDIANAYDGRIYVGECCDHTPGGIGKLVKFDPTIESLDRIADLAEIAPPRRIDLQ